MNTFIHTFSAPRLCLLALMSVLALTAQGEQVNTKELQDAASRAGAALDDLVQTSVTNTTNSGPVDCYAQTASLLLSFKQAANKERADDMLATIRDQAVASIADCLDASEPMLDVSQRIRLIAQISQVRSRECADLSGAANSFKQTEQLLASLEQAPLSSRKLVLSTYGDLSLALHLADTMYRRLSFLQRDICYWPNASGPISTTREF